MKNFLISFALALVFLTTGCDEKSNPVKQEEHFDAHGVVFKDATKAIYMRIFEGQISSDYNDEFEVNVGVLSDGFDIVFLDKDGKELETPDTEEYSLSWVIDDPSVVEVWQHEGEEGEFEFHLRGLKEGKTKIEFRVMHGDHADFKTPKIEVHVEDGGEAEIVAMRIIKESNNEILSRCESGQSINPLIVNVGSDTGHLEIVFLDSNGEVIAINLQKYKIEVILADDTIAELEIEEGHEDAFEIKGLIAGNTNLRVKLYEWHDDHYDLEYESCTIPIAIN